MGATGVLQEAVTQAQRQNLGVCMVAGVACTCMVKERLLTRQHAQHTGRLLLTCACCVDTQTPVCACLLSGLKLMTLAGYNPKKGPEAFTLLASEYIFLVIFLGTVFCPSFLVLPLPFPVADSAREQQPSAQQSLTQQPPLSIFLPPPTDTARACPCICVCRREWQRPEGRG